VHIVGCQNHIDVVSAFAVGRHIRIRIKVVRK